jgi:hypothetical protein
MLCLTISLRERVAEHASQPFIAIQRLSRAYKPAVSGKGRTDRVRL